MIDKSEVYSWINGMRERLSKLGIPVLATYDKQTDADHVADFESILEATRSANDGLHQETPMHYIMDENGRIICCTGNTEGAADRAYTIFEILIALPHILDLLEVSKSVRDRISELLDHNNQQLMELRAQRQVIKRQEDQISFLISCIPVSPNRDWNAPADVLEKV